MSLKPLLAGEIGEREKPIGFRYGNGGAMIDNDFKLLAPRIGSGKFDLFHLEDDPAESSDVSAKHPEVAKRLQERFMKWHESVEASIAGKDYPEGKVDQPQPPRQFWTEVEAYQPYFKEWKKRPEYESRLKKK
jgi:hypothetical protein